jgi:hypothetical protein
MTYICIRTFESTSGITYTKNRVIPLFEYTKLNYLEQRNFEENGEQN